MIVIRFLMVFIFLFFLVLQVYVWVEFPIQTFIVYVLIGLAFWWMIHNATEMPENYEE